MAVTYADIVRFYKDKADEPEKTKELIDRGYVQEDSGYRGVANVFQSYGNIQRSKNGTGNRDDHIFYWLIEKRRNTRKAGNKIEDMQSFAEMSKEDINDLLNIKDKDCPSQKWHLFVSYMAYQELNAIHQFSDIAGKTLDFSAKNFTYYSQADCAELILWMTEAAKDGEIITQEDVNILYEEVCEFYSDSEQGGHWKDNTWWKDNKGKYWDKLQRSIEQEFSCSQV